MATATLSQLQMETPPLEEYPTESENLQLEEEDNSGNRRLKKRHFEGDSDSDEDDSDNESGEKRHFEDDPDILEAVPMMKTYYKQVEETEGYGVTCRPNVLMYGRIVPVDEVNTDRDNHLVRNGVCVKHALDRFNKQQDVTPLQYVELVQATYYISGGYTYYITFKAEDPFGNCKVYQTKVFHQQHADVPLRLIVRQFRVKPEAGKQPEDYDLSPSEEEYKTLMS
ncbi:hypothetical protein Tsubulata_043627 [Turnera subulata]|uniref:Cystatin domain-containing protein n=1 Tax=Turnera subulata TaxID=218843 RepID=A0A9Q0G8F0_9ROSI|nr:hypothetical protein Tsubulata_043627 [Turnera subulata]